MPEDSDYTPAPWSTHDSFASARASYDAHAGRSYNVARTNKIATKDLVPDRISSNAAAPIVILVDQTGSMWEWPATIFEKLPYLDHEAKFYFGEDYAIAFGAFGDAHNGETYPVQMRPFAKGNELQSRLKELVIEGKGGGQMMETSELAALYVDRNVDVPKAVKPVLIIITDEKAYDVITPDDAGAYCNVKLQERLLTKKLFASLKEKWSVYLIAKPYHGSSGDCEDSTDREVRLFWAALVGADHIALLSDARRVVDVIFGIFAQETGKNEEFEKELNQRQLKDAGGKKKVDAVLKSLVTIRRGSDEGKQLPGPASRKQLPAPDRQRSVTKRGANTSVRPSKSLLDDDE